MLELARRLQGVQIRSVEFAMKYKVPLWVKSSFTDDPGTLVCEEDKSMEDVLVSGIALHARRVAVRDPGRAGQAGVAAKVFGTLRAGRCGSDVIVRPGQGRRPHRHAFTVGRLDVEKTNELVRKIGKQIGAGKVDHEENIAKVSIVRGGACATTRSGGEDVPGARRRRRQHPRDQHLRDQDSLPHR